MKKNLQQSWVDKELFSTYSAPDEYFLHKKSFSLGKHFLSCILFLFLLLPVKEAFAITINSNGDSNISSNAGTGTYPFTNSSANINISALLVTPGNATNLFPAGFLQETIRTSESRKNHTYSANCGATSPVVYLGSPISSACNAVYAPPTTPVMLGGLVQHNALTAHVIVAGVKPSTIPGLIYPTVYLTTFNTLAL